MSKKNDHELFTAHLPSDLLLKGQYVSLEPMELKHIDDLSEAASDGALWNLKVTSVPNAQGMKSFVENAIERRIKGRELPFVVRTLNDEKVVGTTRFYNINSSNRNLSIGYTWYAEPVQRTAVNTECKLLLLTQAFEKAACISVQWHTHHENIRSQQAIKRLGATFEGVLRNHMIMPDGRLRHTHCFSMLDDEWPASKLHLQQRLNVHA